MSFYKIRYTNGREFTAGLIVSEKKNSYKNLFPKSENGKLKSLQVSKAYSTWNEAFNHQFANIRIIK